MKKTVSVNIKGINFLIEEDAYGLLQDYLDRLSRALNNLEGHKEIIEDVELRIAELCSSKLKESKTVIELADIEEIIAALGNPEDYIEESDGETSDSSPAQNIEKTHEKRLFRDVDDGSIAGVCMGLSNYLSIDVVIVRAIFLVILLFGGFGAPLYLVLWVIVPKAKSTIDRLRMKGRPITVGSLREEVGSAADKIKDSGKNMAQRVKKDDRYQRSISKGARILRTIVALGLFGCGLSLLIPFLIFVIGGAQVIPVQSADGFLSLSELGEITLINQTDFNIAWWGAIMGCFSAVLFLFLIGISLVFNLKNKWLKISLLGLFLTGIIGGVMGISIGIRTARDLAIEAEIESEFASFSANELTIIPTLEALDSEGNYEVKSNGDWGLMGINNDSITLNGVHIRYVKSADSLYHITKNISSRSHSYQQGITKCQNIKHEMSLNSDTLKIASAYSFPRKDKLRDQEVYITIEIPEKGKVLIDNRIVQLDQVDQLSHYIENGLVCGDGKYRKLTFYID
tara:strand:+ start:600 stop:2138 length:1539 start_codon:yes stop_codon:yes gene_type:complete